MFKSETQIGNLLNYLNSIDYNIEVLTCNSKITVGVMYYKQCPQQVER